MNLPEKSVKQFITEMRMAGFEFEYKAISNDGLVVESENWVDDDRVYREVTPYLAIESVIHEKKNR